MKEYKKWLYPEILGAGRFAHIGIPGPEVMGSFVGMVEMRVYPDRRIHNGASILNSG
jgi:hypothetical protein